MISQQTSHMSYLGLSLLLANIVASLASAGGFLTAPLTSLGFIDYRNLFFYAMIVTAVCLGFILFARRQWGHSPIRKSSLIIGIVSIVAGDVCLLLALTVYPSSMMFGIAGCLAAICVLITTILWGIAYGNLSLQEGVFYTSCSFGVAAVLALVLMALTDWALLIVMMLTPLLSLLCLVPLVRETERAEATRRDERTGRIRPEPEGLGALSRIFLADAWPIFVGGAICLIFLGLLWNAPTEIASYATPSARGCLLGVIIGSVVLAFIARMFPLDDQLRKVGYSILPAIAVLPLVIAALQIYTVATLGMLFGLLTGLACTYFAVFCFCILVDCRKHWGVSRTKSWCVFFICAAVLLLFGFSLSNRTEPRLFETVALSVFLIYLVLAAIKAVLNLRHKGTRKETTGALVETQIERECQQLTERYSLSPSESTILSLLVHGRSADDISQSLALSPDSVESGISHLFGKLDVHSRQELINLFD